MRYLVDTCVLSDLVAQRPNPGLVEWVDRVDETRLCLCVISIGEIQKGIQIQNGLTLVTRIEADFLYSGVTVLNPWRD